MHTIALLSNICNILFSFIVSVLVFLLNSDCLTLKYLSSFLVLFKTLSFAPPMNLLQHPSQSRFPCGVEISKDSADGRHPRSNHG